MPEHTTPSSRPTALPVLTDQIPAELCALPQWVTWRYVWLEDRQKWDKPPRHARTGRAASSTDPKTWRTYVDAVDAYERRDLDGIGFVVTEANGLVGVDLDHCRIPETGEMAPWAWAIAQTLDSYTEVSPSGTGLRIWLKATRPPKGRRKGDIEVYSWGRYLTVTGWHVAGTPATIEARQAALDAFEAATFAESSKAPGRPVTSSTNGHGPHLADDAVIERARAARNGWKFDRLMDGNTSDYGGDDSRADLALCCELAFWTQDEAQIDRLFRGSGLYREKWERADYRDATIAKALATTTEHWTPPRHRSDVMNGNGQQASDDTTTTAKALPVIQLSTNMTDIVDATQRAILARPGGSHLFQRARQLCLIAHGVQPPKWLRRPADAPVIVSADPPYLRELATQAATWEKYDKRAKSWERTLPPPWVIETLVARPVWPFPPLEGVVCAPTLRPDGSLLDTPGYDRDTGLYLALNGTTYPPIPGSPTRDDARTAIGRLRHVFVDFPFAEPYHGSATLAAVLSLVARYAIQGNVPLFSVRSTTRGAGKGLLIDAISIAATGRHAPRWAQADDDEEERKRLLTIALAGDPLVHIDNVTRALGSGPLDLALTAPTFADRILGKQVSREAPMHVIFFASGNRPYRRDAAIGRHLPL